MCVYNVNLTYRFSGRAHPSPECIVLRLDGDQADTHSRSGWSAPKAAGTPKLISSGLKAGSRCVVQLRDSQKEEEGRKGPMVDAKSDCEGISGVFEVKIKRILFKLL